jgi:FkbM family methyltransferase
MISPKFAFFCWRKYIRETELRLAARLAKPGVRCIDVGANVGVYSYFMRRAGARVHAFEPIPQLAEGLRRRFGTSIEVHEYALSHSRRHAHIQAPLRGEGPLYGYASLEHAWSNAVVVGVETTTLDSFGFADVRLVKVDVEGHELAVLEGARDTIAANRPALIIEAEERHRRGAVRSVSEFLGSLGYKGAFFVGHKLMPIAAFSVDQYQKDPNREPYVFNLVFVHSSWQDSTLRL